jgi:ABC-type transporter Mla subunit MlaD
MGLVVIAATVVAGWLSIVAINGSPFHHARTVAVELPAAGPIVKRGTEARIAGQRVGQVRSLELQAGRGRATVALDDGVKLGRGATATVRPRGLAGAVYVEVTPGDPRAALADGAVLRSDATTQLSDVVAGFDRDSRAAVRRTLSAYGAGVAGRGPDLNATLGELPPTLERLTPELRAVRSIGGVTSAADTVALAVAPPGDRALAESIPAAHEVVGVTAARASDLADAIAAMPPLERRADAVLPAASALLADAAPAAAELRPGVAALRAALPHLEAIERRPDELTALGELAARARPVLSRLRGPIGAALGPANALVPLIQPATTLAVKLAPYRRELRDGPLGFTKWGDFKYDFGTGAGHRAVRFSMILTCATARDPYPAPDQAPKERKSCP